MALFAGHIAILLMHETTLTDYTLIQSSPSFGLLRIPVMQPYFDST